MSTIYIAGKVTGLDHKLCTLKFQSMEDSITAKGYTVVNPMKLITDPNENWLTAMHICLNKLQHVDGIFMMPCSVDSPGAQLELQTAIELNLDIYAELSDL